jgi:hypothetical protein
LPYFNLENMISIYTKECFYGKFQNSQISMRSSSRWAKNIEEMLIFFEKPLQHLVYSQVSLQLWLWHKIE